MTLRCLTTFSTFRLFGLSTHIWTFQLFRSHKADSLFGVEANVVVARVVSVTTRKYHYLKLKQVNGDKDDDDDDDDGGDGGARGLDHEVRQSSGWLTQT